MILENWDSDILPTIIIDLINCAWLDWEKRHKIIGGIAWRLLYLYEDSWLCIIHCGLLDWEMNPRVCDFNMVKLLVLGETQGNTSKIVGIYIVSIKIILT